MANAVEKKVEEIHRILAGHPAEKITISIFLSLLKLPQDHLSLLSYKSISNIAKVEFNSPDLMRSITILTSPSINVLSPIFLFVASDGEEHIISRNQWAVARKNGFLVDPHSGEKITNIEEVALPYFSSTSDFAKLVDQSNG